MRSSMSYTAGSTSAGRAFAAEDLRDLLVGEAPGDADGGVGEAHLGTLADRREVHERALDEADTALLQAGQAVGDRLGKHRQHTLRQIDAGGALAGFAVERTARRREVGHVGDVHAELPVLARRIDCQRNGVVEVARVHRVDGHRRPGGKVFTAFEVFFAEAGGRLARFFERVLREAVGQAQGADDRQRIDAGLAARAEHFDDDALAAILGAGKRSISTTTLSLARAPLAPGSPTKTLCANTVPSTRTSPWPSRSK